MTDNDDAAAMAYLKSVTSIKRRCFRKGFVGINEALLSPSCKNGINVPHTNHNDESNYRKEQKNEENSECRFRLPKRKRKRRIEELLISDESGNHNEKLCSVKSVQVMDKTVNVAGQNKSSVIIETSKVDNSEETLKIMTSTPSQMELTTARTTESLQNTRNKIPLLSKILALSSTIDYRSKLLSKACSPPILFVESTVSRLTLARERFVFLRGAVEDSTLSLNQLKTVLETEHANHQGSRKNIHHDIHFPKINSITEKVGSSSDDENYNYNTKHFAISNKHAINSFIQVDDVVFVVNKSTEDCIKELLSSNFGPTECCCWSLQETRRLLTEMLAKRKLFTIPASSNVSELHNYIELHGPTTNELPSLSKLIWLSSASTTLFFTVLIQHFLRSFSHKCKECGAEVDQRPEYCSLQNTENANNYEHWVTNFKDNKNNNNMSCTENSTAKENGDCQNIEDDKLTKQQKYILLFFSHLMPTLRDQVSNISQTNSCNQHVVYGYGVWLLALCVALDTPLDPDTDRIVHELFVIMCTVIRALGDERYILNSERGTLLQSFEHASPSQESKKYTVMKDVGKEEVMALYTFVIIFAKFFRQNQDHVIEL